VSATDERPVVFACQGDALVGIYHALPTQECDVAILIVVGGPQYRVGSHRQFVSNARSLSAAGYPVLRFDYRGMGDSEGEYKGFEHIASDIKSAIGVLYGASQPRRGVVLLGLCDAASAALTYCASDTRVVGLILMNPWVRSEQSQAEVVVKRYYASRLRQADFWRKLTSGDFDYFGALRSLFGNVKRATQRKGPAEDLGFIHAMRMGLAQFSGPVLIVQSGRDLTADEFRALCRRNLAWREALSRADVQVDDMIGADHTFSDSRDLAQFNLRCIGWLAQQFGSDPCR
jgi:exosortase A-associated hydrolase 1